MIWLLVPLVLGALALGVRAAAALPGTRTIKARGRAVWIWIPPSGHGPLVVLFHGFGGRAETVGNALVTAFANARMPPIVVIPQLGPESEPGDLADSGGLRDLLATVRAGLGPAIGTRPIVLAHSGGYKAAAAVIDHGGVPIAAVGLLDALYGSVPSFEGYATRGGRFADVYGPSTAALAVPLGQRLVTKLGPTIAIVGTDEKAAVWSHRVATFPSAVAHPDVPARYVTPMLNAFGGS